MNVSIKFYKYKKFPSFGIITSLGIYFGGKIRSHLKMHETEKIATCFAKWALLSVERLLFLKDAIAVGRAHKAADWVSD